MAILNRIRALFGAGPPKVVEARDAFERELLTHDFDAVKSNGFVSAGDGAAAPTLPEVTPDEIYHEFEHDEERPRDQAP